MALHARCAELPGGGGSPQAEDGEMCASQGPRPSALRAPSAAFKELASTSASVMLLATSSERHDRAGISANNAL